MFLNFIYALLLIILGISLVASYRLKNMEQYKRTIIYNSLINLLDQLGQGRVNPDLLSIIIAEML